jgi:hypothetical protein
MDVDKIFGEYFLTFRIKYLVTWRNVLPHVHGYMVFMDENMDEIKWITFL